MNYTEISDLEEGEILEYDSVSTNYSRSNFGIRSWSLESSIKDNKNGRLGFKDNKDLYLAEIEKDVYINGRRTEKLNHNAKAKSSMSVPDMESVLSEGEYKSDEDEKHSTGENGYYGCTNGEVKKREKHPSHFYGTVEDIMSEIGETICRKSRCNYKKRKSKDIKQNLEKCSNSSYNLWRREIFSSHVKSRKHKRKGSFCDSDPDLPKYRPEKRKRRKKREVYYGEGETEAKKLKMRDFDEMRRNLLEKLKKQKAEEELKESTSGTPLELENSEIQEIDMLIDCTNYVDNPAGALPSDTANEGRGPEEKDGEDEFDLIQLRLIALASNKKRKAGEVVPKVEKSEDFLPGENTNRDKEELDVDRNELLLRAEALKTALLKKHQKRLNKMKLNKPDEMDSINDAGGSSSPHPPEESPKCAELDKDSTKLDADACKENVETKGESPATCSNIHSSTAPHVEVDKIKANSTAFVPSENSKKPHSRARAKRKKKKPVPFANCLKENEKSQALEEDDSTLRTQLLSDLMKKKSLKDLEKKSVLMDSIQTSANKPSSAAVTVEPPKAILKPLPGVKKNPLKKINVPKTVKPVPVPKFPKPEIQRIIVHLGSEDSSDDDGGQPQASLAEGLPTPSQKDSEGKGGAAADPPKQGLAQANYERSVDLLLSQARKKIEGEKRTAASTATPEAVYKHLPPSQRLEYMRLKQKIAERENLRKLKKEEPAVVTSGLQQQQQQQPPPPPPPSSSEVSTSTDPVKNVPPKPKLETSKPSPENTALQKTAPKAQVVRNSQSNCKNASGLAGPNGVKKETSLVVNKTRTNPTGFPGKNRFAAPAEKGPKTAVSAQRNSLLSPSSQALISKLKLLLKKIKLEKMVEENYEKEISKLKNQLGLFEKKKCEQRFKIKKLWEESMKTYNAVQGITGKSREKTVPKEAEAAAKESRVKEPGGGEKSADGKNTEEEVKNEDEKTEEKEDEKDKEKTEEGKKVSDEPETEISKAQSKSDKELNTDDEISETVARGTWSGYCPMKYDSPLQVFSQVSGRSPRVDPNVVVCQFDLMGVCKDEECAYQHLRVVAK